MGDWVRWLWDRRDAGCGRSERIDVVEGRDSLWDEGEDGCGRRARKVEGGGR